MKTPPLLRLGLLALAFLGAAPLFSATFTVTSATDTLGLPQAGEIYTVVLDAQIAAGDDTIVFHPSLDGATINLTNGDLLITTNIIIDASALPNGITIVATSGKRVFTFASGNGGVSVPTVTMKNLTLSGGGSSQGGAIQSLANLSLQNVTLSGNTSTNTGGGIDHFFGNLVLEGCTFANNTAATEGGALRIDGGVVTMTNCTFTGNSAPAGAAIYAGFNTGTSTLTHCTVSGNTGGTSAIHLNLQGNVAVNNSIVASNAPGQADFSVDTGGILTATGTNLLGRNDGVVAVFPTGPLVGTIAAPVSPLLGALASNGGRTQTMLPANNSPVRDAASTGAAVDQRGVTRPKGSGFDLGSVEIENSARIASLNSQIAAANLELAKAKGALAKAKNAAAIRRARASIKKASAKVAGLRAQLLGL
ncbi:MAG: hypothetical protein KGR69_02090 [Verrucomicrobia bacterium]|nr:hypothetical protein [Verrucomicrobiota bacterium]